MLCLSLLDNVTVLALALLIKIIPDLESLMEVGKDEELLRSIFSKLLSTLLKKSEISRNRLNG